jgi:hypothetical protein
MAFGTYHTEVEMGTSSFLDDVDALRCAMAQILRDMGDDGLSVSPLAKAQARVAFEAFSNESDQAAIVPLESARATLAELDE